MEDLELQKFIRRTSYILEFQITRNGNGVEECIKHLQKAISLYPKRRTEILQEARTWLMQLSYDIECPQTEILWIRPQFDRRYRINPKTLLTLQNEVLTWVQNQLNVNDNFTVRREVKNPKNKEELSSEGLARAAKIKEKCERLGLLEKSGDINIKKKKFACLVVALENIGTIEKEETVSKLHRELESVFGNRSFGAVQSFIPNINKYRESINNFGKGVTGTEEKELNKMKALVQKDDVSQ